jgi:hypothetical protein
MTVIRFNQWREFVEELESSPPDDRVVRVTASLRYDGQKTPYATLVAGCMCDDRIVEYVRYLGPRPCASDGRYEREITEMLADVRGRLEKLGYRVRSGRYHVPFVARR